MDSGVGSLGDDARSPLATPRDAEEISWHLQPKRGKLYRVKLLRIMWVGMIVPFAGLGAAMVDQLSVQDVKTLQTGRQVVQTEKVEGLPWPRFSIYQVVKAKPEEAIAVFFDYNNARDFIPNVKLSEISRQISASSQEVSYSVDVPILADECYTTRNSLSSDGDTYRIQWTLLKATSMKSTEGCFTAEPMGDGQCLIRYRNLVDPGSKFAGVMRGFASKQIVATVAAIAEEIESQKATKPAELQQKVERLQTALQP